MIIEARNDVVTLRGSLGENHWPAIAAAVDLLLPEHPSGILIDCSGISSMTDVGAATLLDGLSALELVGARLILCAVPDSLSESMRLVPGLHSQAPIAPTVEIGRQSLEAARAAPLKAAGLGRRTVVVPVNPPFSAEAVRPLISRLHLGSEAELHLLYVVAVPRSLPVGAPLPEEEGKAESILARAEQFMPAGRGQRHLVRGRNVADAILEAVDKLKAVEVIAGLNGASADDENVMQILQTLRNRCPCELTVTQQPVSAS